MYQENVKKNFKFVDLRQFYFNIFVCKITRKLSFVKKNYMNLFN